MGNPNTSFDVKLNIFESAGINMGMPADLLAKLSNWFGELTKFSLKKGALMLAALNNENISLFFNKTFNQSFETFITVIK